MASRDARKESPWDLPANLSPGTMLMRMRLAAGEVQTTWFGAERDGDTSPVIAWAGTYPGDSQRGEFRRLGHPSAESFSIPGPTLGCGLMSALHTYSSFPMTYLKDLIDIRDHVGRGDFVLRLGSDCQNTDPANVRKNAHFGAHG